MHLHVASHLSRLALLGLTEQDTCGSGFETICNGTNVMAQRNYPADNYLVVYFGPSLDRTLVGESAFKAQLYQSMVGQALNVAMKITDKRVSNCFGTMIWQLGEVRVFCTQQSLRPRACRAGYLSSSPPLSLHSPSLPLSLSSSLRFGPQAAGAAWSTYDYNIATTYDCPPNAPSLAAPYSGAF